MGSMVDIWGIYISGLRFSEFAQVFSNLLSLGLRFSEFAQDSQGAIFLLRTTISKTGQSG